MDKYDIRRYTIECACGEGCKVYDDDENTVAWDLTSEADQALEITYPDGHPYTHVHLAFTAGQRLKKLVTNYACFKDGSDAGRTVWAEFAIPKHNGAPCRPRWDFGDFDPDCKITIVIKTDPPALEADLAADTDDDPSGSGYGRGSTRKGDD